MTFIRLLFFTKIGIFFWFLEKKKTPKQFFWGSCFGAGCCCVKSKEAFHSPTKRICIFVSGI